MLMARDIQRALDPATLAREVGIEPDGWQKDLLRNDAKRVLMLCSRQSGKTETAILKALHAALYDPGLIIVVSPSLRQSSEVFKRLIDRYSALKDAPKIVAESALRAEFENGSRIISLPGSEKTVRGYSKAKLIVLDEAARTEDSLIAALRPMMATSAGSLIALSTPAGKRGWFFEAWTGQGNWHRVKVPASECPRISQEFLDEELAELGPQVFRQEYDPLDFVDDNEAVFPTGIITNAFSGEVRPLWT